MYAGCRSRGPSFSSALSLACGLAPSPSPGSSSAPFVPSDAAVIAGYLVAYGFGAFDLLRIGARGLMRGQVGFDIDLLMLLAAAGQRPSGEWVEGAFLLFLFSLANALEHYAMGRATQCHQGARRSRPGRRPAYPGRRRANWCPSKQVPVGATGARAAGRAHPRRRPRPQRPVARSTRRPSPASRRRWTRRPAARSSRAPSTARALSRSRRRAPPATARSTG